MRQSGLFALFGAAIVAVVVAVLISLGGGGGANDPLVGRPVIPDLDKRLGEVAHITVIHGETTVTLARKDGVWTVPEKDAYPADPAKMRQVLLGLAALRYAEPKTAKPDLYSRLDVEDPDKKGSDARLITLSDDKGALMGELIVGKRRYDMFGGGNDGVYIRTPGQARAWLAGGSLDLPNATLDWLDRNLTQISIDRVKSASFTAADGTKVTIARDQAGAAFAITGGVPAGQKPKGDDSFNDAARALSYFDLDDVKPAAAVPFPDKGTNQAAFTTLDGLSVTVTLLEQDEPGAKPEDKPKKKYWAKLAAAGTGAAAKEADALNKKLGAWVYAIPEFKATSLSTKLSDLTEPEKGS